MLRNELLYQDYFKDRFIDKFEEYSSEESKIVKEREGSASTLKNPSNF